MNNLKCMSYSEKHGPNLHPPESAEFKAYEERAKVWESALRTNMKFLNEGKSEEVRKLEQELAQAKKKMAGLENAVENLKKALNK